MRYLDICMFYQYLKGHIVRKLILCEELTLNDLIPILMNLYTLKGHKTSKLKSHDGMKFKLV